MATVKCKCGNTYFARVSVNQFKDNAASLHTTMHEVDPDHDIKIYQCINTQCGSYVMPPINYFNTSEDDKEIYAIIEGALSGKIIEPKAKFKSNRIQPGTARFVGGENDQENNGKFVPIQQ